MNQNSNPFFYNTQQNQVYPQNTYSGVSSIDPSYGYDQRGMNIARPQPTMVPDNIVQVMRLPYVNDARNYPVAPGNAITFFIEKQPYVCTKQLGKAALDQPVFRKWKLTEETDDDTAPDVTDEIKNDGYVCKEEHEKEISSLNNRIDKLEKMLSDMQTKIRPVKNDEPRKDHKQQNWRNKQQ